MKLPFGERVLERLRGELGLEELVSAGLQLGEHTHIARPVYFDGVAPWLIKIEDHAMIGPYASLIVHDATLQHYTGKTRLGCVIVGKRVQIGTGAVLLPGTDVGDDSVVGAGAVVHGKVPPGSLVMGNPAETSPIERVAAWQVASSKRAPSWPHEGWTLTGGITDDHKREQWEALRDGSAGYVPAIAAPGSPLERAQKGDDAPEAAVARHTEEAGQPER